MSRPLAELPAYIEVGGAIVMCQPVVLESATMYSLLLEADPRALAALVAGQLGPVLGDDVEYRPLMPMVCMVCADIAKSFSQNLPGRDKGWMRERDFGFWVPLVRGRRRNGGFVPEQLVWYLPYVFVDNVAAMATGRDVWGFHKQTATLAMPAEAGQGDFTVDTLFIRQFAPQSEGEVSRLVTATPTGGLTREARWSGNGFETLLTAVEQWLGDRRELAGFSWDLVRSLWRELQTGEVPMVFLKQLRDAGDGSRACYQAVIEAPARLTGFHGGGFLSAHEVVITAADSHPIAGDLGLGSAAVSSPLGFWTAIDFVMDNGRVIAERG